MRPDEGAGLRPSAAPGDGDPDAREIEVPLALASEEERLAEKSFAALTPDEMARLRRMMSDLELATPQRRKRRVRRARRGERLDLRRTMRASMRAGGDPIRLVRRRRRTAPRRLVMLCDISGSMEPYGRAYLQLLRSAVASGTPAEAFVFATRLTRLTRALGGRNPEAAIQRAAAAAPDWSSGTRIGQALKRFNDRYGRRGMARGAVVVILSDGWERADPALVGREMERLSRLAHRIVWVNPRASAPGFEPRTGGMAAALPHCDALVSGHSLARDERARGRPGGRAPGRAQPAAGARGRGAGLGERRADGRPAPRADAERLRPEARPHDAREPGHRAASARGLRGARTPGRPERAPPASVGRIDHRYGGRFGPLVGGRSDRVAICPDVPSRHLSTAYAPPAPSRRYSVRPERARVATNVTQGAPSPRHSAGGARRYGSSVADGPVYRAVFIRMHPTGKAVLSLSEASQGTEAELAATAADELGIPPEDVKVVHEDTDRFGIGNSFNAAPSDAVGENVAITARKLRDKAELIAALMLDASPDSLQWEGGHWSAGGKLRPHAGGLPPRLRRGCASGRRRGLARRADDVPARRTAAGGLSARLPGPP